MCKCMCSAHQMYTCPGLDKCFRPWNAATINGRSAPGWRLTSGFACWALVEQCRSHLFSPSGYSSWEDVQLVGKILEGQSQQSGQQAGNHTLSSMIGRHMKHGRCSIPWNEICMNHIQEKFHLKWPEQDTERDAKACPQGRSNTNNYLQYITVQYHSREITWIYRSHV